MIPPFLQIFPKKACAQINSQGPQTVKFYLSLISSGNFSFTESAVVTGNGSERVTEFSTKTRSAATLTVPTQQHS